MDMVSKLSVAIQVAQALLFLHTSKPPMAHLDVKPANVLVSISVAMVRVRSYIALSISLTII